MWSAVPLCAALLCVVQGPLEPKRSSCAHSTLTIEQQAPGSGTKAAGSKNAGVLLCDELLLHRTLSVYVGASMHLLACIGHKCASMTKCQFFFTLPALLLCTTIQYNIITIISKFHSKLQQNNEVFLVSPFIRGQHERV